MGKCGFLAQDSGSVRAASRAPAWLPPAVGSAGRRWAPAASVPLCTVKPRGRTYTLRHTWGPDHPVSVLRILFPSQSTYELHSKEFTD